MSEWACQEVIPEIFFLPHAVKRAKFICQQCPAIDACFQMCRDIEEKLGERQQGVWAGNTAEDRRRLYPIKLAFDD